MAYTLANISSKKSKDSTILTQQGGRNLVDEVKINEQNGEIRLSVTKSHLLSLFNVFEEKKSDFYNQIIDCVKRPMRNEGVFINPEELNYREEKTGFHILFSVPQAKASGKYDQQNLLARFASTPIIIRKNPEIGIKNSEAINLLSREMYGEIMKTLGLNVPTIGGRGGR